MAVPGVASEVPVYAVWFASSGVLVAATGFLAARDAGVAQRCGKDFDFKLGALNQHLSGAARLAQTIITAGNMTYDTMRDRDAFEKLYGLVLDARRATRFTRATTWLTRIAVVLVALHVATGIGATCLALMGVLEAKASAEPNVVIWAGLTGCVGTLLLVKATISATKG